MPLCFVSKFCHFNGRVHVPLLLHMQLHTDCSAHLSCCARMALDVSLCAGARAFCNPVVAQRIRSLVTCVCLLLVLPAAGFAFRNPMVAHCSQIAV